MYIPLRRPHDPSRGSEFPQPPPGIPSLVTSAVAARIAQRLGIRLSQVDEMSIEEYLDEAEIILYLHDCDNPPKGPPVPKVALPGRR